MTSRAHLHTHALVIIYTSQKCYEEFHLDNKNIFHRTMHFPPVQGAITFLMTILSITDNISYDHVDPNNLL